MRKNTTPLNSQKVIPSAPKAFTRYPPTQGTAAPSRLGGLPSVKLQRGSLEKGTGFNGGLNADPEAAPGFQKAKKGLLDTLQKKNKGLQGTGRGF